MALLAKVGEILRASLPRKSPSGTLRGLAERGGKFIQAPISAFPREIYLIIVRKDMSKKTRIILETGIEKKIFVIRGQKVMIDRDLAELYGVETKYLNRQVKRNIKRFPEEFMFQLKTDEKQELVSICHQFESMKHSSTLPYAFTEHGVAMLSGVLKSRMAIEINILIIKTFIRLREYFATHKELAARLTELEHKIGNHDEQIAVIFEAIRKLMEPPPDPPRNPIGFVVNK